MSQIPWRKPSSLPKITPKVAAINKEIRKTKRETLRKKKSVVESNSVVDRRRNSSTSVQGASMYDGSEGAGGGQEDATLLMQTQEHLKSWGEYFENQSAELSYDEIDDGAGGGQTEVGPSSLINLGGNVGVNRDQVMKELEVDSSRGPMRANIARLAWEVGPKVWHTRSDVPKWEANTDNILW